MVPTRMSTLRKSSKLICSLVIALVPQVWHAGRRDVITASTGGARKAMQKGATQWVAPFALIDPGARRPGRV